MASSISPLHRRYFSRRPENKDLQLDEDEGSWVGILSPWALFYGSLFLLVPICYVYIALVLLRELCHVFPETLYEFLKLHAPNIAGMIEFLQDKSYRVVELWCWIEGIFFIGLKFQIRWLQRRDPLEASLSAAPIMDADERQQLWDFMLESEHDIIGVIRGWFFDEPLENIR